MIQLREHIKMYSIAGSEYKDLFERPQVDEKNAKAKKNLGVVVFLPHLLSIFVAAYLHAKLDQTLKPSWWGLQCMLPLYLVDSLQGQRKVSKSEGASSNVVGIKWLTPMLELG